MRNQDNPHGCCQDSWKFKESLGLRDTKSGCIPEGLAAKEAHKSTDLGFRCT